MRAVKLSNEATFGHSKGMAASCQENQPRAQNLGEISAATPPYTQPDRAWGLDQLPRVNDLINYANAMKLL